MYSSVLKRSSLFAGQKFLARMTYSTEAATPPQYKTLSVTVPKPFVYHVELNRPKKLNAMDTTMWLELRKCFNALGDDADCRVVVLSGAGRLFSAGVDLTEMAEMGSKLAEHDDVARRCKVVYNGLKTAQEAITSLEKCPKPVINAVHNGCIGAGVNLITAADIRYCTSDAWFQVREVNIGMAADLGALQRLPKIIGSDSLVRELAFTGRKFDATEAKDCGMVSKVFSDRDSMINAAIELGVEIASKSPVGVQLTKRNIVYSRDHTVQEGLDNIRDWNMTMLQSEDFLNATMAHATKSPPPEFAKL